jgi:hypothetical protein
VSNYISGGLVILLLAFFTLLGMQAYAAFDTARSVTAAVEHSAAALQKAGGISSDVEQVVAANLAGQGLDPALATIEGTRPAGQPWGTPVTLRVVYQRPLALARLLPGIGFGTSAGTLRVERHVTVASEVGT